MENKEIESLDEMEDDQVIKETEKNLIIQKYKDKLRIRILAYFRKHYDETVYYTYEDLKCEFGISEDSVYQALKPLLNDKLISKFYIKEDFYPLVFL